MQQERNYLIKKVFPDIRRECRRRNVEFTPLDLRWGITEEEASNGRVVEICMDEIERTRPFFIGLVGGRYGWVPEEGDVGVDLQRLASRYPWISPYLDSRKSITEMEMLYGVLDNPEPVEAHFFLRNELAVPRRFREKDPERRRKLSELRGRIRRSAEEGRCTASDYTSVASLGRAVHRKLMEMIDRLYPLDETPDIYSLYVAEQERKLADLRKVYVPSSRFAYSYFIFGTSKRVELFTGATGSGLSALLANMFCLQNDIHGKDGKYFDFAHDIIYEVVHTIVDEKIDTQEILKRMFVNILRKRYPDVDVPALDSKDSNPIPFTDFVNKFPYEHYIWVIDGVEKLSDAAERNLGQILCYDDVIDCFVISCSDPEVVNIIKESSAIPVTVRNIEQLTGSNIQKITSDYLRHYSKTLNSRQISAISTSPVFTSVKMLRAFLDKLVTFGIFEDVDNFIHSFATLDTSAQFYDRMLQYLEEEHGADNVRELFLRLQASSIGMTEEGLFKGITRNPLEHAALLASVEPWTHRWRGNIQLVSGDIANAVASRYPLSDCDRRRLARLIIADCRHTIKILRRENPNGRFLDFLVRHICRGIPGMFEDNEMVYISKAYMEIIVQYDALGKKRKIRSMLRHFGFSTMLSDLTKAKKVLEIIRRVVSRPARMFDSFDLILEYYLLDHSNIIPQLWKMYFSDLPAGASINDDIRRKWLPKKIRESVYKSVGINTVVDNRPTEELFDENHPDEIPMGDLMTFSGSIGLALSYNSENYTRTLFNRLMKAINNCKEESYTIIYIRAAAFCAVRLGLYEEWKELKQKMLQSDRFPAMKIDFDFLSLFNEVKSGQYDVDVLDRTDRLVQQLLSVDKDPDKFQLHILSIFQDCWSNFPLDGKPTIAYYRGTTEAMRSLAAYVPADSRYSMAGRAADAVFYAGCYDMVAPAYRAILERPLETGPRIYYLIQLAYLLGIQASRKKDSEIAGQLLSDSFGLYDEAINLSDTYTGNDYLCTSISTSKSKMKMAAKNSKYDLALEIASDLLEHAKCADDTEEVVTMLNFSGNYYAWKSNDCREGSPERIKYMRKAAEYAIQAFNLQTSDIVLWINCAYDILWLHDIEPQSRENLEYLMEHGERFFSKEILENTELFARCYLQLALATGREKEAEKIVAKYPDVKYFDRTSKVYPILYRVHPELFEDSNYAATFLVEAQEEMVKAYSTGSTKEAESVLEEIVECRQEEKVFEVLQSEFKDDPEFWSMAIPLASMTGKRKLAAMLDSWIARSLTEKQYRPDDYIYYYFARLIADGKPFFKYKNYDMLAEECRNALIDSIILGGEKERKLYEIAQLAIDNEKEAAEVVRMALKMEGPESKTLQEVAKRFCDEISEKNHDKYLKLLSLFVGELEKAAEAGANFPGELIATVRDAVEKLCKYMYEDALIPKLHVWRIFVSFLRRLNLVLPAYLVLGGIDQLEKEECKKLFFDYINSAPKECDSDGGMSAVYTTFCGAFRRFSDDNDADAMIDFLLQQPFLNDKDRKVMMGEKALRQRRLGDYKGALEIYRKLGEEVPKSMPGFFDVITSLLAGELDNFELKLDKISSQGTELEIGLCRAIYCLKVDNFATAKKLRASLPEVREERLGRDDLEEDAKYKLLSEAEFSAYYNIELVRYYRRHGGVDPAEIIELLDEAERLLNLTDGYVYFRNELARERALQ